VFTLPGPAARDVPELGPALGSLGAVARFANPSLWDAIGTAIIRQVVRAAQARAQYQALCAAHGTPVRCGAREGWLFPSPQTVLSLGTLPSPRRAPRKEPPSSPGSPPWSSPGTPAVSDGRATGSPRRPPILPSCPTSPTAPDTSPGSSRPGGLIRSPGLRAVPVPAANAGQASRAGTDAARSRIPPPEPAILEAPPPVAPPARPRHRLAELNRRIARNEAAAKGLITELAQLGDSTSSASIAYRTRIREHFTQLHDEVAELKTQLADLDAQAAKVSDATLIEQLPYAPGLLAQSPDEIRAALFAALQVQCTYRADQKQVTIRATITDSTPGIVAALLADLRTGDNSPKGSADPFGESNAVAVVPVMKRASSL
jgi:hypothetical protein